MTAAIQERVRAGSRFAIPALLVEEAPHGHLALGAQMLPTALGAAATWRPELLERAAEHTARELRARGVNVALVSGLDLLRDPRWGRAEECFGEDRLLASLFTRAVVRGMQSEPGLAVVLKHFAGQGAAIGGRNASGAPLGPREMDEVHLPAARAGVAEGALGLMAAYNDVDGVPCIADGRLLTRTLRDEWGFEGVVVADMFAVDRLLRAAPSPAHAGALALRAGVDLSMCDVSFAALEQAVEEGLATEADVDRACRRVLGLKIRLGLLDEPTPTPSFPRPHRAGELVRSGLVLLQNRGDLLPLSVPPQRVAVIGPNSDDLQALLGDYVPPLADGVGGTVLDGVRALVADVRHELGSGLTRAVPGGLDRARALAAEADLVVLVLGSSGERAYEDDFQSNGAASLGGRLPLATTGEGFDAAEVELPAPQRDLVAAVASAGTPVVAVVVSGRPLGLGSVVAGCDAVLYAWYPGPDGGRAVADVVLDGDEPTGRLPVSLPRSSGALPVAYDERIESTLRYVDSEGGALFAFGAGLGYSTWRLGPAVPSAVEVPRAALGTLTVGSNLTNTGPRAGHQVVQLYARARVPGLLPRRAVLLGLRHVRLDAGEERVVDVGVETDALAGLGLTPKTAPGGILDLWLSVTGAGEPAAVESVRLT